METLVITIQPRAGEELLRVEDAMQQVLDLLRLHNEARRAVARPEELFEWTLERASTNSPFMVTARADPLNPEADVAVASYVRDVSREFSSGIRELTERGAAAWWMGTDALATAAAVFKRNENGISATDILASGVAPLRIDRDLAIAGVRTISAVDVLSVEAQAGEGEAWGEIRGTMDQAGRHYRQPALRLQTVQYGPVWCRLPPEIAGPFGHETTLEETWSGKHLAIEGRLIYGAGGRLNRVIATGVRQIADVPPVDLDQIRDPDFTGGYDPVEYLTRLHEGDLG